MVKIELINALSDNYIACLINSDLRSCVVVDPGDALPVLNFLEQHQLNLSAILITHRHWDHTNGIKMLTQKFDIPVYGPVKEPVPGMTHLLNDGDHITLPELKITLKIMHIPGHTLGHIAYYNDEFIFCGDTLFTGGCGKIFEGTVEQMYHSLIRIASLNEKTLIYCGHEYTASNLKFAQTIEPNNLDLQNRLKEVTQQRQKNLPTVPAPLSIEKLTNPFLRCSNPAVKQAAENHDSRSLSTPQEVLGVIREWKNQKI